MGVKTLFIQLTFNLPFSKVDVSSSGEFHYPTIYSSQKAELSAGQQAHGNIFHTTGVCGRSCHLIKAITGTVRAAGQPSQRVCVLTKARLKTSR